MPFFYWNPSFEIGIAAVDAQHRRLVDLVNALAATITDGGKLPQAEALLTDLMRYAGEHFADEERLMIGVALADAEFDRHCQSHRAFETKVREIARRSDLMQADVAEEVLEFLTTWLVSHILVSDRKIATALQGRAEPEAEAETPLIGVSLVERVLIRALGETERRFRLISDYTPTLIWVCDPHGNRGYVNRAWPAFVGIDERGAESCDWLAFVHPEDRPGYEALLAAVIADPRPAETEYRLRRPDGTWAWVLERILPRHDDGRTFLGLIASATDVTAIKRSEVLLARANRELEQEVARRTAQLEQLMLTDPLTGVGNRRFLTTRLDEEIQRARRGGHRLTAAFVDLDHFKHINDRHGHPVGDRVLTRVATCLRANLRETDILGRFGGEEFVVLMVETGLDDAMRLAERLRGAVERIRLIGLDLTVSASAGLAEWRDGESGEALLERADRALYRAKESGRNRCIAERAA
ncbi:bacteriohemerythrin [Siculibacillus lacustris]|uniref:diguanylate cyclase n=1 Tax=Siculibacillus lacustris TaxID=1549641 RepID=A0A4V2KTH6_9HYPH|nr:bacteriohemerythrin [Siculibacillus lacustris]TBW37224.1 bacteriohemerythrin [Siculibacillus lacustris]